jgi:TnpA family transposase
VIIDEAVSLRAMNSVKTIYPRLPDILDEESLAAVGTLESRERHFACSRGRGRQHYLRALYLKAFRALGHGHLQPIDVPRQLRLRILEQLGQDKALADIRTIDRRERSRILADVRGFLNARAVSAKAKQEVEAWLRGDLAQREGDIAVLSNAAIERFQQANIELPPLRDISAMAERALRAANTVVENAISKALAATHAEKLSSLIDGTAPNTFERFKEPAPSVSPQTLQRELLRLQQIDAWMPNAAALAAVSRRKMEQLANLAKRYNAAELLQLRGAKRRAVLACFLAVRRAEVLDDLAEMFIRTWENTKASADSHAEQALRALEAEREYQWQMWREVLQMIRSNRTPVDLWHAIHLYGDEHYDALWDKMSEAITRTGLYHAKLEDHYASLRRFLPQWYASMPLSPTTADDALLRARDFLRQHSKPNHPELPTQGAPTRFLSSAWASRALRRLRKSGEVVRILKAPYELGWTDATADALKTGALAIPGAQRYAALTDHLLDRDGFLRAYSEHATQLGLPEVATEYYAPLKEQLQEKLGTLNARYDELKRQFWINRDGTLGFSSVPGQKIPRATQRLSAELTRHMPEVTVLDVLLDAHRWTGFMDAFVPLSGRQNMAESEKIRQCLAALHAYGCNCGPTQSGRAVGLSKSQVVYMRRHYMGTKQLIDAASMLEQAYSRTPVAQRLDHPGVLLSDAMHVRTLARSLTARSYFRDVSHKNVLLYQHVTAHCICRFTQALVCNVSEAIHMLHGVLQCRQGGEPITSICDSGGKSDLVFGLASLLNILLYPRLRSRNLKLWAPDSGHTYDNLPGDFAGVIRWDWLDEGWRDMLWILASVAAGTASPALIFERLATQPKHPATRAFQELGKLERSLYALRYGMEMDLRRFVVPHTARREHWNKFARGVQAFGDLLREKSHDGQEEVFWFLTVVQNAIVLWNALALDKAVAQAQASGVTIREQDLNRVLPTMLDHINFVGRFDLDLRRRPPFQFAMGT